MINKKQRANGSGAMISAIRVAHGNPACLRSHLQDQPPELPNWPAARNWNTPSRWDRALSSERCEARTKKIKYLIIIIRFYRFMESHISGFRSLILSISTLRRLSQFPNLCHRLSVRTRNWARWFSGIIIFFYHFYRHYKTKVSTQPMIIVVQLLK